MNKKFFTLLAVALFGTSAAYALPAPIAPSADAATKLKQGGLYHVGDNTNYLYVEDDALLYGQSSTLANGLWCVKAGDSQYSTYPFFTFENKGEEKFLSVDLDPYLKNGEEFYEAKLTYSDIKTWKFSSKYVNELDNVSSYLMSYLPGKDSVAVLSVGAGGKVYVNIVPAPAANNLPAVATGAGSLLEAQLHQAAPITLDAVAFNTLFGSQDSTARVLNYIKPASSALKASPFTDKLSAMDASNGFPLGSTFDGYMVLKNEAGNYLRVDTTVYNTAGDPYLQFAYSTPAQFAALSDLNVPGNDIGNNLKRQHYFKLTYLPSADSLIVNVYSVYLPAKGDKLTGTGAYKTWALQVSDDTQDKIASQIKADADDATYLVAQNLTEKEICLTIGKMPVQLHIGLTGFKDCTVADDQRVSLASDLYTIQNAKGQYLVAPIYTDSVSSPMWVTLETNVNPSYIPAYQWLVVRDRDDSDKSTLTVSNREYTNVNFKYAALQLRKDKATQLFTDTVRAAGFTPVDAKFKKDPYLGYKYINNDDVEITSYVFKYLHKLAGDNNVQLGVNADSKDSLLYVGQKTTFELHPSAAGVAVGYGNHSTKIKDLAKLQRLSYQISVKDVANSSKLNVINRYIGVDKENRYAVVNPVAEKRSIFYLKANNVVGADNEVYYALVDTNFIFTDNKNVKAGVDDNNLFLKAQSQREVRTSAFSISESESPLYRRFNREGAVKSDNFYSKDKAADKRDTLKFFRVNESNNFLYEDANSKYSKGLGINFLGQKHKSDFDATQRTIQMIVDTAYVARPAIAGALKETPKPQYLLWSTLRYVDGTESWDDEDECHCEPPVVTDPYSIGRLLINATDSTKLDKVGKNYMWDNQWERLIFTWAVRNAENPDILYIINPTEFVKVSPFSYKALEASKAVVRKIDLGNNSHKDVAFSFRLYENEDAIDYAEQVQNFFIESESGARENGKQINDRNSNGVTIAPMVGGWVKIHNGVPVISRGAFDEKKISDAERFNVEVDNSGDTPVANEDVNAANGVKVTAEAGVVRIQNGADKSVTISNILGQTIASQIITSDDVTIAAPKGIVVVSVAGEKAVKAIVK